MSAQQLLFLLCAPYMLTLAICALSCALPSIKRAGEFRRAALDDGGHRDGGAGGRDGRRLGHQVEVQELDELELDLTARLARLEDRGDGQQAVEVLEGARVLRRVEEGTDEGYDGCGLDCRAVDRFEEVEEVLLFVSLAHQFLSTRENAEQVN